MTKINEKETAFQESDFKTKKEQVQIVLTITTTNDAIGKGMKLTIDDLEAFVKNPRVYQIIKEIKGNIYKWFNGAFDKVIDDMVERKQNGRPVD